MGAHPGVRFKAARRANENGISLSPVLLRRGYDVCSESTGKKGKVGFPMDCGPQSSTKPCSDSQGTPVLNQGPLTLPPDYHFLYPADLR